MKLSIVLLAIVATAYAWPKPQDAELEVTGDANAVGNEGSVADGTAKVEVKDGAATGEGSHYAGATGIGAEGSQVNTGSRLKGSLLNRKIGILAGGSGDSTGDQTNAEIESNVQTDGLNSGFSVLGKSSGLSGVGGLGRSSSRIQTEGVRETLSGGQLSSSAGGGLSSSSGSGSLLSESNSESSLLSRGGSVFGFGKTGSRSEGVGAADSQGLSKLEIADDRGTINLGAEGAAVGTGDNVKTGSDTAVSAGEDGSIGASSNNKATAAGKGSSSVSTKAAVASSVTGNGASGGSGAGGSATGTGTGGASGGGASAGADSGANAGASGTGGASAGAGSDANAAAGGGSASANAGSDVAAKVEGSGTASANAGAGVSAQGN